jgi:hypothetical protein
MYSRTVFTELILTSALLLMLLVLLVFCRTCCSTRMKFTAGAGAGAAAAVIASFSHVPLTSAAHAAAVILQNMLEHEDEIYSRPARTWFQTEKQKKEAAAAAAAAAEGRTVLEDAAGRHHTC